jgi:PBSX family phage terminase large subunit
MVNTLTKHAQPTGLTLEHEYSPRGGCLAIFKRKDAEVLISGPAGTGKSRACLEKVLMMCLRTPNLRAAVLRKTLASLGSTALVTWRNYVAKEALATGECVYYGGSAQEPPQYRFKNGSTVTIGGMDRPTRIMSSEYDLIYIQEATELTLEDIEFINTRLRNWRVSFQQLLMDCNPAGSTHWLKRRANDGKTVLIESRHEDNPVLFDLDPETGIHTVTEKGAAYISKLDNLTGVRHKRLRLGLWVSSEGIIYENFDPAKHVVDWEYDEDGTRIELPDEWERYWVVDFGFVHPFVLQWWAVDPDGNAFMYREIYYTHRTIDEHAKTILSQVTTTVEKRYYDHFNRTERVAESTVWTEPKPTAIICDHDAQARRTLEKALGMGTQPAMKDVDTGIDLTDARWKVYPDGTTRMFYMTDTLVERDQRLVDDLRPTCTKEEVADYRWKVMPDGRTKSEPVKQDDDGMDATRYFVMHVDFKGKARYSEITM